MGNDAELTPEEKAALIKTSFEADRIHLRELERLRREFEDRGIDITTAEGRREFTLAVRQLNSRFV